MYARCAAMHDALHAAFPPTGVEEYARSLNVCPTIQFCGQTWMIEMPDEMVDQRNPIDRSLHLHRVGNLSWNNCDRVAELATRLLHIPSQNTYILLLFDQ